MTVLAHSTITKIARSGDAAALETARDVMSQMARGAVDPAIREKAAYIVRGETSRLGIINAVWSWARDNIRYVDDPVAVEGGRVVELETIRHPAETLRRGEGDCDDHTALMGALLLSLGVSGLSVILCRIGSRRDFSHIVLGFWDQSEQDWFALETTERLPFATLPPGTWGCRVIDLVSGGVGVGGLGDSLKKALGQVASVAAPLAPALALVPGVGTLAALGISAGAGALNSSLNGGGNDLVAGLTGAVGGAIATGGALALGGALGITGQTASGTTGIVGSSDSLGGTLVNVLSAFAQTPAKTIQAVGSAPLRLADASAEPLDTPEQRAMRRLLEAHAIVAGNRAIAGKKASDYVFHPSVLNARPAAVAGENLADPWRNAIRNLMNWLGIGVTVNDFIADTERLWAGTGTALKPENFGTVAQSPAGSAVQAVERVVAPALPASAPGVPSSAPKPGLSAGAKVGLVVGGLALAFVGVKLVGGRR